MNKFTVLVTSPFFGSSNPEPFHLLEENGGRILRLELNGRNLEELIAEHLSKVDAVIAGLETYNEDLLQKMKRLKVISRYGVGYDNIHMPSARKQGICVTVTPGVNSASVAEMAFALLLCCARKIVPMNRLICAGCKIKALPSSAVYGKTLGVLGTGQIGRHMIRFASGFGMNILANDIYPNLEFVQKYGGHYVDLETLFREADFITLHIPLTENTYGLVDAKLLHLMKPTAILINTARGGIVDEAALYEALKTHMLLGAGLDATLGEQPHKNRLAELENCIVTPHAGALTAEAIYDMGMLAAKNVLDVLNQRECQYTV